MSNKLNQSSVRVRYEYTPTGSGSLLRDSMVAYDTIHFAGAISEQQIDRIIRDNQKHAYVSKWKIVDDDAGIHDSDKPQRVEAVAVHDGEGWYYLKHNGNTFVMAPVSASEPLDDDSNLASAEWLIASGMTEQKGDPGDDWPYHLSIAVNGRVELSFLPGREFDGWGVYLGSPNMVSFSSEWHVRDVVTRGHVRRLCESLGIELKQESAANE